MGDARELEFKEGPNREKLGVVINLENWRNYLCVCVCVCVFVFMHVHVEVRGQPQALLLRSHFTCSLSQGRHLDLGLTKQVDWLANEPQRSACLPPQCKDYKVS